MKAWTKIIIGVVGSLIILAVILIVVAIYGSWNQPIPKPPPNVRLTPLAPPISRAQLTTNNAAFYYLKAAEQILDYRQSKESHDEMEALLGGDSSGDFAALKQTLKDCAEPLRLLREGATLKSCQMPGLDNSQEYFGLQQLKLLGQLESCLGRLALRVGDSEEMVKSNLILIQFGNDCTKGGPYLAAGLGYLFHYYGCSGLRAAMLTGSPTTNAIKSVIQRLDDFRGGSLPASDLLRYDRLFMEGFLAASVLTNKVSPTVIRDIFDAAFGEFIQEAEKPLWEADMEKLSRRWDATKQPKWRVVLNRHRLVMIPLSTTIAAFPLFQRGVARHDMELEATRMVCALRGFTFTHGKPPDQLSELVPEFLASLPIDSFDGKPMRYRRDSDGWVLWSVGSDRKDDNAALHEYKYRNSTPAQPDGDIYFKSTEAQDDLREYRTRKAKEVKPLQ